MRNIFIILIFSLSCQISFAQELLNQNEIETFKQNVIELDRNTTTIVSDFIQYKHLSFLNNDIKTLGKLVFKMPHLVKWEYTSPYQYSAIFKDDKLFINDGGDKSNIDIGSNKMFKSLNNLIINSVKGGMFDENEFVISYSKLEDNYIVTFIPKDENMRHFITYLELIFNIKTYDVVEVKMIEQSSDYTRIIFENKTRNTSISDEVFNN